MIQEGQSQLAFGVITTFSHLGLLAIGFWYNEGRRERHNAWAAQLREDVFGTKV